MNRNEQNLETVEREQISVLELFGGIGACTKALKNLGLNVNVIDYVEIDKYACKSYNAINGTNFEPQDIKEWNKYINVDLIMHGSPCQDFSVAGKQAGGDLGSGTRSSLLYETIRIVGKLRPKYVVWENVKNLLSKKHKHNFDNYIETMNILGYNSYYRVLNAKDYGIPQNRERVYTISIRKDIDNGNFKFPEKEELKIRLKDILENEVDEKYYLSDDKVSKIEKSNFIQEKKRIQDKEYSDTILARDYKDPKCVRVGGIFDTEKSKHQAGSIYDKEGLAPTLDAMQGGWRQPSIVEDKLPGEYGRNFGSKGKIQDIEGTCDTLQAAMGNGGGNTEPKILSYVDKKYNDFIENKGYFPEMFNPYHTKEVGDIAPTQTTQCASTTSSSTICINNGTRVRKLTPLECWRLMSFDDEDFYKAQSTGNSNSQLYKQAGNSIVVKVLEKIFRNLLTLN